jgi:hypothetical protein
VDGHSRDVNELDAKRTETQAQLQARPLMASAEPTVSMPSQDGGWAGVSPSHVVRTVAIALLTAAVVIGALFLLWQVRTFVGWFVIALFLAAVLNPAVNWLQRRHHLIKRPLAIALTYLGVLVAVLFVAGIFLPLLVDQVRGLINFVVAAAQAPEGPTEYIRGIAEQSGLGGLFERFGDQIAALRDELGQLLGNLFLSTGQIAVGAAGFVAALATVLTLTFFLILGSERYVNAGVKLFAEAHRPLVRSLLKQSAGAVSGYVTGNLAISVICGVVTFVVLLVLGMPYAAPLALLVAVLDLHTAGGGDARRGAARRRGFVRRAVEGGGVASVRAGLPAGGEQPPAAAGLQPGRPAQRACDPDRPAGGRAAARHPRGSAGHPHGRDHPDSRDRRACLPAREANDKGARRRVLVASCYLTRLTAIVMSRRKRRRKCIRAYRKYLEDLCPV